MKRVGFHLSKCWTGNKGAQPWATTGRPGSHLQYKSIQKTGKCTESLGDAQDLEISLWIMAVRRWWEVETEEELGKSMCSV